VKLAPLEVDGQLPELSEKASLVVTTREPWGQVRPY